jgi:hypothetical protein
MTVLCMHPAFSRTIPPWPAWAGARHDVQLLAVHDSLAQPHSAGFSRRGTIGSNPFRSSGESCELRYGRRRPADRHEGVAGGAYPCPPKLTRSGAFEKEALQSVSRQPPRRGERKEFEGVFSILPSFCSATSLCTVSQASRARMGIG